MKDAVPEMHVHAFSPLEITHGARTLGLLAADATSRELRAAGLATLPGTAAEILDDEVRARHLPGQADQRRVARRHARGARGRACAAPPRSCSGTWMSRCTGRATCSPSASCSARRGGFTEFVPLPFVHMEAPLWRRGLARSGPTLREALLMHAVARLALHPHIRNIQTSWVKMGPQAAALCLEAGANDLGGTLMNESITRAAGGVNGQEFDAAAASQRSPRASAAAPASAPRSTSAWRAPSAERARPTAACRPPRARAPEATPLPDAARLGRRDRRAGRRLRRRRAHGGRGRRRERRATLVVEKSELFGGTSATSGGVIWIPATQQALEGGHPDTPEEAFQYIRALSDANVPDARIWAFVRRGREMVAWLEAHSAVRMRAHPYADYHPEMPGGKPGWRSLEALPLHASDLGADFAHAARRPHPAVQFIGRVSWTLEETGVLLFRTARLVADRALDLRQLLPRLPAPPALARATGA